MSIRGQWLSSFGGTNRGMVIINIDYYEEESYRGWIFIFDQNQTRLGAKIEITQNSPISFRGSLDNFITLDPNSSLPLSVGEFRNSNDIPQSGVCNIALRDNQLIGSWNTNIGTNGEFAANQAFDLNLDSSKNKNDSENILTWGEFKARFTHTQRGRFIYRGQPNTFKLRTSYHCTKRSDLIRYGLEDIPELQRYMCSALNFSFDLGSVHQYAALLHLAQHHGYPTPLLDWTESPYIAAYFAFEKNPINNEYVSIFEFNSKSWCKNPDNIQISDLGCPNPSLTLITPLPLFNKRSLPQQSVSMFSNIDGVQDWIKRKEEKHNTKYLNIIRIKASEKELVLNELNFMGLNSASLFPGLDGICKLLRERNFGH